MLTVYTVTQNGTVAYAAEEFKKYLRMMMPDLTDVRIVHDPFAKNGFRLGLMQDFGLDVSDAEDVDLDDILYVNTDKFDGVIAGDNPRSVLLAVYEFFRQNGCRWLFPGHHGEYIPQKEISAVKYRHKPHMRYRGPCIEGAVSREIVLETIDFLPKVGMNLFMMQFLIPKAFYYRYYARLFNPLRPSQTVSKDTVMQWKAECECEIQKRGIQFHDIGHGWTAAPFGIDVSEGWTPISDDSIPKEMRPYLALLNGERKLFGGSAINTQFCMSNPEARRIVAEFIAEYAENHRNADYIHVWLADAKNNHCECEECAKKSVSDWYVVLLNDIDQALTAKSLDTGIVFIAYTETTWAPETEKIVNADRFTLMLAPITRQYTSSASYERKHNTVPFRRNHIDLPKDLDTYLDCFEEWKKTWKGSNVCFEYYFWKHQYYDPSALSLAKRIFEDIEAYHANGIDGLISCGTQRSYFPNGLANYVLARKQFDLSLSLEEITEDYYRCAYGEKWNEVLDLMQRIEGAFGFAFLEGEESEDESISPYYSPNRATLLDQVPSITAKIRELTKAGNLPSGLSAESYGILSEFADYADLLSAALSAKANGKSDCLKEFGDLKIHMAQREIYLERYFDHYFAMEFILRILKATGKVFSFT